MTYVCGMVVLASCGAVTGYGTESVPLECRQVTVPPVMDGRLDEQAWKDAKPLQEVSLTIRGVVYRDTLYLALESRESPWPDRTASLGPLDDPAVKTRPHAEVAVSAMDRTIVYRVLMTSDGAVFDMKQRPKEGWKGWIDDPAWASSAKVTPHRTTGMWSAELIVPLSSGIVQVRRSDGKNLYGTDDWHLVKIVTGSEKPSAGELEEDIKNMSEDALFRLADRQADLPATLEAANAVLKDSEDRMNMMSDATVSDEQLKVKLLETFKLAPVEEGMPSVEESVDQAIAMRQMMSSMAPAMRKHTAMEHALINAASEPAFLHTMREQYGEKALSGVPGPEAGKGISFSPGAQQEVLLGRPIKGLPKKWDELTEEQFQAVRHRRLMTFSPAGKELIGRKARKMLEQMRGDGVK